MAAPTLGITYNAVAKTLTLIREQDYGATYFLDDSGNDLRFTLKTAHTIPASGGSGESHMVRLDVEILDSTSGELVRTVSSWFVMRTSDAVQNLTSTEDCAEALVAELDAATITKLASRVSDIS